MFPFWRHTWTQMKQKLPVISPPFPTLPVQPTKNHIKMKNEHIQLLHDDSGHWLTFCSNESNQICDSSKKFLSWLNRKCVHALYKNCVKDFIVSILSIQKQTDGCNCGPFAIPLAANILDGKSPIEARFGVERMRGHLINCFENKFLMPFPKVWSHLRV